MGFCLLNSIAIAATHALSLGAEKVLVIDFDVHHGNGTQEIFYENERVAFFSSHRFPFYPGSGERAETGSDPASASQATCQSRLARLPTRRSRPLNGRSVNSPIEFGPS
ncbi:MAG: hypothetical protein R3B96_18945 [Pirellulaceae bacterium]